MEGGMNTQSVTEIPNGRFGITGFDPPLNHEITIHTTAGDFLVKGDDVKKRQVFMGVTSDSPFVERSPDGKIITVGMAEGPTKCIRYSLGVPSE